MCERRLLRELNPRRQMTQRIRPRLDEDEEEEEPSQVWNSSEEGERRVRLKIQSFPMADRLLATMKNHLSGRC